MYRKLMIAAALAVMNTVPSLAVAEDKVWSTQNYNNAWALYNQKYSFSMEALKRAFPGNDFSGKQTQNSKTGWVVEPQRVVAHAADVDQPVRAMVNGRRDGEAFVAYLKKPDVQQWYKSNFKLK